MTLEFFKKEKVNAMKERNKDAVSALNVVISKIMNLTIEKRAENQDVTEVDIARLLTKVEKELLEEREGFIKANRQENVDSLTNQLEIIKKYLPKLLTEEEIKNIILGLEDKTMPFVMKYFKQNYDGQVDMKQVGTILKTL